MIGFTHINKISITNGHIDEALEFLRYAGKRNFEAVCLFAGIEDGDIFYIKKVIIPKQMSYKLESGLMYAVDSEELHLLNVWLYENDMKLIAQIHSHPTEAYHSEADDRFPIVDTYGGVSIVVPNFAIGVLSLNECAIYRLSIDKTWDVLKIKQINLLFEILK